MDPQMIGFFLKKVKQTYRHSNKQLTTNLQHISYKFLFLKILANPVCLPVAVNGVQMIFMDDPNIKTWLKRSCLWPDQMVSLGKW